MPTVGIAEAAKLAGVNQSTVHRAMRSGRLSYSTDPTGKRRIDVAELGRVFELKAEADSTMLGNGALSGNGARTVQSKGTHSADLAALRQVLDERERTVARLDETIRDLRDRLDASEAERRRAQERLTGLLTHRQAGSVPAVAGTAGPLRRESWWRRWRR